MAKLKTKDDDDEYRNDPDPKGFKLWSNYLSGKWSIFSFVEKVTRKNWQDAHLHAKALTYFLANGKFMLALKSAILLKEKHPSHPKTPAALAKFFKAYLELEAIGPEKMMEAVGGN